ncbi:MAG: hypothetical protein NVSMB48_20360 [Marmoricola sp.]
MTPPSDDPRVAAAVVGELTELSAASLQDRDLLAAQVAQAELAERRLARQLATAVGGPIHLRLAPCPDIEGTVMRVGSDHLWIADRQGFWLVVIAEVDGFLSWTRHADGPLPESPLGARGLASALRELVGDGTEVSVLVGQRWFTSRLTAVGADFVAFDDFTLPLGRIRACRVWY